jgi:hypothetical protein
MRTKTAIVTSMLGLLLTACTQHEADSKAREAARETREATEEAKDKTKSVAREAGKAAQKLADETKEAATKMGTELKKAGKEAKAGWEEGKRESDSKK